MPISNEVLLVIACGKSKIWSRKPHVGSVKARDAYVSNYFRLCARYAEKISRSWVILSGKHGILRPDDILFRNYDTKLKISDDYKARVSEQFRNILSKRFTIVVSLCGGQYSALLKEIAVDLGFALVEPMRGMRIGERQHWLKQSQGLLPI